jgi:hypothetical protein
MVEDGSRLLDNLMSSQWTVKEIAMDEYGWKPESGTLLLRSPKGVLLALPGFPDAKNRDHHSRCDLGV